jgi:nicotinate-nucleotide adenylyltransferase
VPGPLGVLGGTFDPIHVGHLRLALETLEQLSLEQVAFVPCREPPHRESPLRPVEFRLELLRAAIAAEPRFRVDQRELQRAGPSYTIDTLTDMRREQPERPLCLLLGMDAFLGLPTWHRWTELSDYAHIVVAHRPGWVPPGDGVLGQMLAARRASDVASVHEQPGGLVVIVPITQLEISSTALRRDLAAGRDPRYLVPDAIRARLLDNGVYR